MQLKKIVFLGSKPIGYQCFHYLIENQATVGVEIIGLLTKQRNEFEGKSDLKALAQANNITILNSLDDIPECDIIYSVQHHELLSPKHIAKAKELAINLHMAPLPEYRGANQFTHALLDQKTEFGTTIHIIDADIDHGDILFQKRFPIPENLWVSELYQMTEKASVNLFKFTLAHLISGNFRAIPQQDLVHTKGSSIHYKNELETLKNIDLSQDKVSIERQIRATFMPGFKPPYCIINDKKFLFKLDNEE